MHKLQVLHENIAPRFSKGLFIQIILSKGRLVHDGLRLCPGFDPRSGLDCSGRRANGRRLPKVFKEKISGAKTDRPELAKVIRRLEPGDVLLVTPLDRLARSTRDLLNVLAAVGERGAGFKSLKDAWADTTTAHGRLMLTVLGGLAEFERELIVARTGEGRLRAKARGVRFGRPRTLTPHQRQEAMQRLAEGEVQRPISRGLTA